MKTRYKIIVIAVCAYFGVFLGPVVASNIYCDFVAQEMCTSRVTGVSLPPFNMILQSLPNDNECFFENRDGIMEPCYIETGHLEWPFPPRIHESDLDHKCDEICPDSRDIIILDETKGGNDYEIQTNMGFSYTEYPNIKNLDAVFRSCEKWEKARQENFTSPDGTEYLIAGVGLEWFNSTHYIDNNICDFIPMKKHLEDQVIRAISEYCGSISKAGFDNPYEYWFANQTHYLDSDTCIWQSLDKYDGVPLILPYHWKNVYVEEEKD